MIFRSRFYGNQIGADSPAEVPGIGPRQRPGREEIATAGIRDETAGTCGRSWKGSEQKCLHNRRTNIPTDPRDISALRVSFDSQLHLPRSCITRYTRKTACKELINLPPLRCVHEGVSVGRSVRRSVTSYFSSVNFA